MIQFQRQQFFCCKIVVALNHASKLYNYLYICHSLNSSCRKTCFGVGVNSNSMSGTWLLANAYKNELKICNIVLRLTSGLLESYCGSCWPVKCLTRMLIALPSSGVWAATHYSCQYPQPALRATSCLSSSAGLQSPGTGPHSRTSWCIWTLRLWKC